LRHRRFNEPTFGIAREGRLDRERFSTREGDFALEECFAAGCSRRGVRVAGVERNGNFIWIDDPGDRIVKRQPAVAELANERTFPRAVGPGDEMDFGRAALEFTYASRRSSAVDEFDDVAATIGKLLDGFLVNAVQNRHAAGELVERCQREDRPAFRAPTREPFFARCAFDHRTSVLGRTFGTPEAAPRPGS